MASYVWIPVADKSYDAEIYGFTSQEVKCIPRSETKTDSSYKPLKREPYASSYGAWKDMKDGDTLIIQAHGVATSTKYIGWINDGGVTKWTAETLAMMLETHLSPDQRKGAITYDLFVCWGGDNILWRDAFGSRLAAALGKKNFRGQVMAYKGSVVIGGHLTERVVQGQGRLNSVFSSSTTTNTLNSQITAKNGKDYIDRFNHYHASQSRKIWKIPN
jgi:hypothetical protein